MTPHVVKSNHCTAPDYKVLLWFDFLISIINFNLGNVGSYSEKNAFIFLMFFNKITSLVTFNWKYILKFHNFKSKN